MLSDGGSECSGGLFIIENWICAMIRHHAESNIAAIFYSSDSAVKQWSHLLIPLHCLWGKPSNLDVMWYGFVFVLISLVHMHNVIIVP